MESVLNNNHTEIKQKLLSDGYVVIDFLNTDELEILKQQIRDNSNNIEKYFFNGIHMTTWIPDIKLKYSIKNEIENILVNTCNTFFKNYKFLNTTYIIKKKHKISNFPVHQDWSFIDESKYEALNLWVALQNIDKHNGGLYVLKGSHKLYNNIRPCNLSNEFSEFDNKLNKYLTPVKLKAGQAILFYYSLIHGSAPNNSASQRLVVSTTLVPEHAAVIINFHDKQTMQLKQYQMNDDFIYNYNDIRNEGNKEPVDGKLINTIKNYVPKKIHVDEIIPADTIKNNTFLNKIWSLLNKLMISYQKIK